MSCSRLFEAEAMRDGRLGAAERASFERHLTTCPVCAGEVHALAELAESLRGSPAGDASADDLRVRRERTRLLAAFDRALVLPERRPFARGRLLWAVALVATVAGIFVLRREQRPVLQASPPSPIVRAEGATLWSERIQGDRDAIVLEDGALWIRVDHASGGRRVVVILPDGELEDTGTIFTVRAEQGHTTRVSVEEGSVVLRRRGRASVSISAGGAWVPEVDVAAAPATSGPPAGSTALAPLASVPSAPVPARVPVRAPPPPSVAPDPSVDFREATAALDRGDNRQAAVSFESFLENHPLDPRAEDAAYLRVIALQRRGDSSGVRGAAQEYLRRYPTGFRRAEVESLSR